ERTGRDAIAAAVANVLLHHDGVELGAEDRPRRAGFEARRRRAMLADIAHHQPVALERRHLGRPLTTLPDLLNEMNVPPSRGRKVPGIVVAGAAQADIVSRQCIPFLARDLAGFAADAQG